VILLAAAIWKNATIESVYLAGYTLRIEKLLNLSKSLPLRLRLLVPSIALIIATTMIPLGFRRPSATYIDYTFNSADFINNLILYLPLGIALIRLSLPLACLCGFFLATCAEFLQLGYVDRTPSPFDIASNTCGTFVGYLAALLFVRMKGYTFESLDLPRWITACTAIPLALLGTALLVHNKPISDFSNWDPSFDLAIGNELTGDRPWIGTISEMAIYSSVISQSSISEIFSKGPHPTTLSGPSKTPAFILNVPPDSAKRHGGSLLSKPEELALYRSLVEANELTILVWIQTNNVEQKGPARIVTYSRDSVSRNFTLGRIENTLTFRLRTPISGNNGTSPALYSGPVLVPDRTAFVAATYDGRIAALYVDGKRAAQIDLGAKRPHLPSRIVGLLPRSLPIPEIDLSASEIFLGALFAIGLFAATGTPRRQSTRVLTGLAAAVIIGGGIWIFGVSDRSLGVHILLECVGAALVVAFSLMPHAPEEVL
jgi:hypothetical protein